MKICAPTVAQEHLWYPDSGQTGVYAFQLTDFQLTVFTVYGLTETCGAIAAIPAFADKDKVKSKRGSAGVALPGVQMKVRFKSLFKQIADKNEKDRAI